MRKARDNIVEMAMANAWIGELAAEDSGGAPTMQAAAVVAVEGSVIALLGEGKRWQLLGSS